MKVFVYSKRTSKKIAEINGVVDVQHAKGSDKITFITNSGESMSFNTKEIKTTVYQN